ncbi:MAG: hypothetical protein QOG87_287 [Actinomycetota bacterium]
MAEADEALRFQAELLDAVGQAVIATDLAGVILYWNAAATRTYGWTAAETMGTTIGDLLTSDQPFDEIRAVLGRGGSWSGEFWVNHRDGHRFLAYVTDTPVFGRDGELVAIIGVSMDITERKAGEDARQQLAAIVESSGDAIFAVSNEGRVLTWNAAAERLFGYRAEEIVGQAISVLAPPDGQREQAVIRARLEAGGPPEHFETTRLRKDGSRVEVRMSVASAVDDTGAVLGQSVIAQDITERLAARRALEASQRRLTESQRIARLGSFEFDPRTRVLTWSEECFRILGLDTSVHPTGELFFSMVHPDDLAGLRDVWADASERGIAFDHEFRAVRADGEERCVRTRTIPELADDGTVARVAGTFMDDTERVRAREVTRAAEARVAVAFEQAAVGIAIADVDGIPLDVNPAMCALLGRDADALIGRPMADYTHPDDVPLRDAILARVAEGSDTYEGHRRYLRPDDSVIWVSSHAKLVRDESGQPQYFFIQLEDVSERTQMRRELAHQELHDHLTGLPNRALLADRLAQGLVLARRRGSQLGVMLLHVDHLKSLNESSGHAAGDDALRHTAACIANVLRPGETVARFGGDDFVMVCDDVSAPRAHAIAERVLEALRRPQLMGGQVATLSASVGIALAERDATPESLLRDADAAMHRAKERGRGRVEVFDEALRVRGEARLATEAELRRALEGDEFEVHYQPVVDLSTQAVVGAEALVRWAHPDRGLVTPDQFIPIAEETGLIVPIGAWVLEEACRQTVEWQRSDPSLTIAVNLSVRQLVAPDVVGLVGDVLVRTGLAPADLCLELTESVLMDDVDYFANILVGLKALGVRLSIDDFGTGYSSLNYLKRFPLDGVKVDRGFVDGLGTDPHDTAIVGAVIAMADALGLEVTAEGVETQDQLDILTRLRCLRAQGFFLARPMPATDMTRLVADRRNRLPAPTG